MERNLNHEQVTHTSSLSCSLRKGGVVPSFHFPLTAIHSRLPQDYNASSAVPCLFIHSIYVIPCLYIRSLSVMLSRISFHVLYGRSFKTLCLLKYALMKRHDYDITVFFTKRGATIMVSEPKMVNTCTDADLSAAVQNALQTLLPQIRAEIREEFHTSSGPSNSGGNSLPVTIHTWLERFNKQKPRSFEKATAPVDEENWISHMEKIFDVLGYEDAFKTRLAMYKFEGNALAWWKAYKQAKGGDAWPGGSDNHRSSNNYSSNNNRETGVSSPTDLPIL
nr:zinc finger, CCHC-type, retrotransposon Gag domain protein [Tanacetum cinerariifolium]